MELMNLFDFLRFLKRNGNTYKIFKKYSKINSSDFSSKFQDPFLRNVFSRMFGVEDMPFSAILMTLAWLHNKCAGYPEGGFLEFAKAIEKRYLDPGGKISYSSRIEKIIVKNNHAAGIQLENGSTHLADIVISAADGHTTVFNMLNGRYINKKIQKIYETYPLFEPLVFVSFGVAKDVSDIPHAFARILKEPIEVGNRKVNIIF